MSDQLVTETSTWQHTTLTTDRHPCSGGIQTHNLSRRAATDPHLRPCSHWDQQLSCVDSNIYYFKQFGLQTQGDACQNGTWLTRNYIFWLLWSIIRLTNVDSEHIINSLPSVCTVRIPWFTRTIFRYKFFTFPIMILLLCLCVSFVSFFFLLQPGSSATCLNSGPLGYLIALSSYGGVG